jgi:hypothetical protein
MSTGNAGSADWIALECNKVSDVGAEHERPEIRIVHGVYSDAADPLPLSRVVPDKPVSHVNNSLNVTQVSINGTAESAREILSSASRVNRPERCLIIIPGDNNVIVKELDISCYLNVIRLTDLKSARTHPNAVSIYLRSCSG